MKIKRLKQLLLMLTVAGIVAPYSAFVPFLLSEGLNIALFLEQMTATRIAQFAWLDVIITAIVIMVAAYSGRFVTKRQAAYVTALTICAGGSAGLPLLLYYTLHNAQSTVSK